MCEEGCEVCTYPVSPVVPRELEYVSNNQKFLDFCRLEIFTNMRPKERTGEEGRSESG